LAKFVASHLESEGISVFLATLSLKPGDSWSKKIFKNLQASDWVLFLASRAACRSANVQQELGIALAGQKNIIPVLWDMDVSELPGWIREKQALIFNGISIDDARRKMSEIARRIKKDKALGWLIVGVLAAGIVYLSSK
jgi:hypothetical protein